MRICIFFYLYKIVREWRTSIRIINFNARARNAHTHRNPLSNQLFGGLFFLAVFEASTFFFFNCVYILRIFQTVRKYSLLYFNLEDEKSYSALNILFHRHERERERGKFYLFIFTSQSQTINSKANCAKHNISREMQLLHTEHTQSERFQHTLIACECCSVMVYRYV